MNGKSTLAGIASSAGLEFWRSIRHPLASDAALLAVSNYVAAGLGFLMAVAAARILGPTDYGIASLVMAYPAFLWSFAAVKSEAVTTRYIASFRAAGRSDEILSICKFGYCLDLLMSLVAFGLVGMTGYWVSKHLYNLPNMSWLMILYAASLPFHSLASTSVAILSSWQRFRWLACLYIFDKAAALLLVFALLFVNSEVTSMVLGIAVSNATIGVIMAATATTVIYREGLGFWWNASLKCVVPLKKELRSLFGWSYVTMTLSGLVEHLPLLLLGRFRGPEEAGYYRLGTSLITIASYVENALGQVSYPVLSARWRIMERQSLMRLLKRWTMLGGIPLGICLLLTIPLLHTLVPIFFGSTYSSMVQGVQVMMIGISFSAIFFWLNSVYYSAGQVALWTKGYAFYSAIVIGLGCFGIQQWGFVGLATVMASAKILFTLLMAIILIAPVRIDRALFQKARV